MFENIVVGTDGSPTAAAAVRQASELARATGAVLHVVSAYRARNVLLTGTESGALAAVALQSEADLEREARHLVAEVAQDLTGSGVVAHAYACPGDPADAIISVADQVSAELIVVGSLGMKGPRRLLGSVPNRVSHHATTSVLIVRTC